MEVANVSAFLIICKYFWFAINIFHFANQKHLQIIKNIETFATSICTHILILKQIGQRVTEKKGNEFVKDLDRRKLGYGRLLSENLVEFRGSKPALPDCLFFP